MSEEAILSNFEQAFQMGGGSCLENCHCGNVYYNTSEGWTLEEGELEELEKNPKAHPVECAPGRVCFGGEEYVDYCHCWHDIAMKYAHWVKTHQSQIAKFLKLEKARVTTEAAAIPTL